MSSLKQDLESIRAFQEEMSALSPETSTAGTNSHGQLASTARRFGTFVNECAYVFAEAMESGIASPFQHRIGQLATSDRLPTIELVDQITAPTTS